MPVKVTICWPSAYILENSGSMKLGLYGGFSDKHSIVAAFKIFSNVRGYFFVVTSADEIEGQR